MKKIMLLFSLMVLLISCKNETKSHSENIDSDVLKNEWVNEIRLDDGSRWLANAESTIGVKNMEKHIEQHKLESVEDYHALASELNSEKNYIVKECTMEGESHDNLHVFLHPLIEKIDALGKVESTEEGEKLVKSIEGNLSGYFDYFK